MRSKEEAHDYRYFPDPDLTPIVVENDFIESIKNELPELPEAKKLRFISEYQLPEYDAALLTETKEMADYYESVVQHCSDYKLASNWVMSEIIRILNDRKISIVDFPLSPEQIAELLNMVVTEKISLKIAKTVYEEMLATNRSAEAIVSEKGLVQISDTSELAKIIEEILSKNPKQVEEYKGGKDKVLGFFVGQVMRATKGQANPALVNKILKEKLAE